MTNKTSYENMLTGAPPVMIEGYLSVLNYLANELMIEREDGPKKNHAGIDLAVGIIMPLLKIYYDKIVKLADTDPVARECLERLTW